MGVMASQITSPTIVYLTVYSGADQRKHQSSTSLAFVWGIYQWPVNSLHNRPVMRKMFPFDDVIMEMTKKVKICFYSSQNKFSTTRVKCKNMINEKYDTPNQYKSDTLMHFYHQWRLGTQILNDSLWNTSCSIYWCWAVMFWVQGLIERLDCSFRKGLIMVVIWNLTNQNKCGT